MFKFMGLKKLMTGEKSDKENFNFKFEYDINGK